MRRFGEQRQFTFGGGFGRPFFCLSVWRVGSYSVAIRTLSGEGDVVARMTAMTAMTAMAVMASVLAGCTLPGASQNSLTTNSSQSSSGGSGAAAAAQQRPVAFAQFSDTPVPADGRIDLDKTIILGAEDGWIGRLSIDARQSVPELYAFYVRHMPDFGWQIVTQVRSAVTTLTYQREQRIATITLMQVGSSRTDVDFMVAPAGARDQSQLSSKTQ